MAHAVAARAIPAYSHPCSPRVFTQHQLFACLVLKRMLKLDDRGVVALLDDCADLRHAIGLTRTPDHSTLHKFAARLLRAADTTRLLDESVKLGVEARVVSKNVQLAAIDSTGMESHHTSRYFVRRREKGHKHAATPRFQRTGYRRFPKLQLLCDTRSHMILAFGSERGPGPDHRFFEKLLVQAKWRVGIQAVAADAGYDSEPNHLIARRDLGIVSLIPCKIGRPTDKKPTGHHRAVMASRIHLTRYGQRWQVETVNSVIKRRQSPDLRARDHHAERRACALVALTHNVTVLLP